MTFCMRESDAHSADTWAINRQIIVRAECMTVSLCTSILRFNAHKGSLSDADHGLHCIRCTDAYNVRDGLESYPPVA